MGDYYGVKKVKEIGTTIQLMGGVQPRVPTGQRLITILDNGLWQIAPDTTTPREWEEFSQSYNAGYFIKRTHYLVPENRLSECPDVGRTPSE